MDALVRGVAVTNAVVHDRRMVKENRTDTLYHPGIRVPGLAELDGDNDGLPHPPR